MDIPYDTHETQEKKNYSIHVGHFLRMIGEDYRPDEYWYHVQLEHRAGGHDRAELTVQKIRKGKS